MRRRKPAKIFTEFDYRWYKKHNHEVVVAPEQLIGKPMICAICGLKNRVVIDHDHATGKFRGLLCNGCNTMLGMAQEDENILRAAASYLGRKGNDRLLP